MTTILDTHGLTRENLLEIDYFLRLTRTLEERLVALFRQSIARPTYNGSV